MKFFQITFWILLAIPLFPIMLIAATGFPAWEKMAGKETALSTLVWILLVPIMIPCAYIAQWVYPQWEKIMEEF